MDFGPEGQAKWGLVAVQLQMQSLTFWRRKTLSYSGNLSDLELVTDGKRDQRIFFSFLGLKYELSSLLFISLKAAAIHRGDFPCTLLSIADWSWKGNFMGFIHVKFSLIHRNSLRI